MLFIAAHQFIKVCSFVLITPSRVIRVRSIEDVVLVYNFLEPQRYFIGLFTRSTKYLLRSRERHMGPPRSSKQFIEEKNEIPTEIPSVCQL